jgi:hypothetical protein
MQFGFYKEKDMTSHTSYTVCRNAPERPTLDEKSVNIVTCLLELPRQTHTHIKFMEQSSSSREIP